MTIIAALPELRNRFFEPIEVVVDDILHRIIGLTPQTHGIKNKTDIITFMSEIEIAALDMN